MLWRLVLVFVLAALPLRAEEEVVLGLSRDRVAITATFEGSDILIFGAVKREVAIPETQLDVVITVSGPLQPVTVWRKSHEFGIWINTDMVRLDAAPSFYAVSTTGPLGEVLSATEDLRHRVSIPRAIRSVGAASMADDPEAFIDALIRIKRNQDAYQMREGAVAIDEQTLFRTAISLPANLIEGAYKTRIFLTREGRVVARYETVIDVRKVGLERVLFTMSRQQPMLYGLMSLAIAIIAGWGASALFQILRRG